MRKVNGYFVSWGEADEILKTVLDDSTVDLLHEDDGEYWAYSEENDTHLEAGEIDARLAQAIGFPPDENPDGYVGFSCCFGIAIVDLNQTKQ